jgi:UDP-N-acetylmuramoyl-L-alanyl-D-glutamate--2,6-diaminopimelate ligase
MTDQGAKQLMTLQQLLKGFAVVEGDIAITGLTLDSRKAQPGDAFVAVSGSTQHGILFAQQALDNGAVAIIYEPTQIVHKYLHQLSAGTLVAVDKLRSVLGVIAARFYANPSTALEVIGITGTNGKTSCSQFLAQILPDCGIIGTLGWGQWGALQKTLNTTPDAVSLQAMLAEFVRQRKRAVSMEVSSHGIEQGRINGITFRGVMYTNISRDHLDYHGSMEAYVQAKLALLNTGGLEFAVINLDGEFCTQMLTAVPAKVSIWGYSLQGKTVPGAEYINAINIKHLAEGVEFEVLWRNQQVRIKTPLYGVFNVENVMAVLSVLLAMDLPLTEIVDKINLLKPVPGRMQRFIGSDEAPVVIVDYAHTPDALENVLSTVKQHTQQGLWVVFGCGGGRDQGKRAQMGLIAEKWADHIVVTNDNPRNEDAEKIVEDILSACHNEKVTVIQDRETAISTAIEQAAANDWVVIAGKGHEDYQEVNGVRSPFSDAEVVERLLQSRSRKLC